MNSKKCPQCKSQLKQKIFDVGYGVEVPSFNCSKCGFNITDEKELKKAMNSLHDRMSKVIKIIRIGNGLGVRIPNDLAKNYKLKNGEGALLNLKQMELSWLWMGLNKW